MTVVFISGERESDESKLQNCVYPGTSNKIEI